MPSLFGAVAIPTVDVSPDLAGDPLVSRMARFLLCALVDDDGLTAAWNQVSPTPSPIRKIFFHDPEDDHHLPQPGPNDLPALYLYRHEITGEKTYVADFTFRQSTLQLRYVYALAQPDKQAERVGIPTAIVDIVTRALYVGRTPSFRIANDPDTQAVFEGSFVPPFLGLVRCRVGKTERKALKLKRGKGNPEPPPMMSTVTDIAIEEELRFVVDAATEYDELDGAEVTILSSDPPTLETENQTFVAQLLSLSVSSGPAAGGTSLTVAGRYLMEPVRVSFGGVDADTLTVDSPVQLTLTTPAHAAGVVDVTLVNGDGSILVLPNGFTFT